MNYEIDIDETEIFIFEEKQIFVFYLQVCERALFIFSC